ncbi:hypothetical protein Pcinc_012813 [Petrolisthes cinctipes]|uniref:G2/mitotic-specific cyclin-B3 n=1 Tax=Petrolisthes cinctipes TaxID=88211 RepID=A0AAE1G3Y0_PETCI|nr:hypothetical protein Pcinc_012813 [Petrolisthes cinctipes]
MASRPGTRGLATRSNQANKLKVQNENTSSLGVIGKMSRPALANATNKSQGLKRKAEDQPERSKVVKATKKRSAFGDITNALEKLTESKKIGTQKGNLVRACSTRNLTKLGRATKESVKPLAVRIKKDEPTADPTAREASFCDSLPSSQDTVFSQESNKTDLDESASYVTASEGSPMVLKVEPKEKLIVVPEGVEDYDKEMENDPFAVSIYANNIFAYYKQREATFPIDKYMDRQPDVSRSMRAILVDWMVEVQESFELNHETLYLAVKIIDLYLARIVIQRDYLQLIGSTAIFIACKFDERTPPYVDDFLYICDDAYKRKELLAMEMKILKVIGFDLGIPLSYRFLRRYARCAKVCLEDLTLARYILEMSLMEYDLIDSSDSALAAAALLLARCIKKEEQPWMPTLDYYSGYKIEDLYHLTHVLHTMISQTPKDHLKTIRNKYSHSVFYKVALIPIPEKLNI